jgi:hypothetical protein
VRDVFTGVYSDDELDGLPLDTPIAYQHPSKGFEDIKIFFASDMPHWVKKFCNAFGNKGRSLVFRKRVMNLAMVQAIWMVMKSEITEVRLDHLTYDHFELDPWKKMRVFLAVQITSQSVVDMIKAYCRRDGDDNYAANIKQYEGMIQLFDKVNRLIDICNGRDANEMTKSYNPRDTYKINHPKHRHCIELFDTLRVFEEWRKECGGFNKKFITKYTYDDLKWLIFGITGLAATYLQTNEEFVMDQGRMGSDANEHLFGMIRSGNANTHAGQANERLSSITATNAVFNASMFREKKGGANTIGAKTDPEEYVRPLPKRRKITKSRFTLVGAD